MKTGQHLKWTLSTLLLCLSMAVAQRQVYVNNVLLTEDTISALENYYQSQILEGNYWYDPVSGFWGYTGGPVMGQILPELNLGGPLAATASGGGSGVYFNGRELHYLEGLYLYRLFGVLIPGYYWLSADGWLGIEGGPALVNLFAAAQQAPGGTGGSGYTSRGTFGNMGSDGNCFYYNDPGTGSSYMPPGCG